MISRSLGSRLTVQGRNISTSCAVSTGVREDRNTSKLRMSPSISSKGSTSLVVGMFLEILQRNEWKVQSEILLEVWCGFEMFSCWKREKKKKMQDSSFLCYWKFLHTAHRMIFQLNAISSYSDAIGWCEAHGTAAHTILAMTKMYLYINFTKK